MIPSKIIKRQEPLISNTIQDTQQMKKVQSNLILVSKTCSLPKQFQKNQKLKTSENKIESIKHQKNNSMNHLQTTENNKIIDSIQNISSIYINNKTEEFQLKNDIQLKSQIDLNNNISQLQFHNVNQQVMISQLEQDIQSLNQTIEKMCEQLQELKNQITKKDKLIMFYKSENQQLLNIIKQGSYSKIKVDKENQSNVTQTINYLKDQIDLQRKQFQQTEDSLQKQISGLNQFVNDFFYQQSSDRLNTNISNRIDKDIRNRKLSLQNDMDSFQSQLQNLDKQQQRLDHQFDNVQCNLNQLNEKHLNTVYNDNLNTQNIKEITKLKQIVQIQKKQIELQQNTILNQHFEIQNLQTLLYKNDQDSIIIKLSDKKQIQEEIISNYFTNSPKDDIYHLNDSQSEIKPKYYLDNIQNTLQKFQVITEESTFRN